ncbi:MAG: hypothetical protein V1932_00890 [Chloroflexota bacterium]
MFGFVGVFVSLIVQIAIIALIVVWFINRNKSKRKLTSRAQRLTNTAETKGEVHMKETMLEQMNAELEKTGQTDTTVNIVGMILNLIFLGVNTGVGSAAHDIKAGLAIKLVFFVLTAFVIVLNVSVGYALMMGKKRRVKITERIGKFWVDEGLGKYQDESISTGYAIRGNLFTIITVALGVVALLISFIAYFVGFSG